MHRTARAESKAMNESDHAAGSETAACLAYQARRLCLNVVDYRRLGRNGILGTDFWFGLSVEESRSRTVYFFRLIFSKKRAII